ncbi:antibiotic biosynthesis monooxygenase [Rhizobium sp. S163]|uniref:putative quinol monooxygenase n=1 Tax=Rhizobium sp. S163 TaxID=3055039 RepID=UPI0025A99B50|nr:antibiotic biosynthesis monooxygenase [Rhizobium sp. S163]MDM9649204.1 antibiotic biosynthesis monooxygenase [Rhizobium sp. S163]
MLIVAGYIYVDPADLNQFHDDLNALSVATRKRIGNISYSAAIDEPGAGRLLVLERWADERALRAHLEAADTISFVDRWSGRMRSDIRIYDASNERALTEL